MSPDKKRCKTCGGKGYLDLTDCCATAFFNNTNRCSCCGEHAKVITCEDCKEAYKEGDNE
jgi:DnaJ-class molecular chaperone